MNWLDSTGEIHLPLPIVIVNFFSSYLFWNLTIDSKEYVTFNKIEDHYQFRTIRCVTLHTMTYWCLLWRVKRASRNIIDQIIILQCVPSLTFDLLLIIPITLSVIGIQKPEHPPTPKTRERFPLTRRFQFHFDWTFIYFLFSKISSAIPFVISAVIFLCNSFLLNSNTNKWRDEVAFHFSLFPSLKRASLPLHLQLSSFKSARPFRQVI